MEKSEWNVQAAGLMLVFVKEHYEFVGEDVNHYVESVIGPPEEANSWGWVFQDAIASKGFAVSVGAEPAKKKSSKARLTRRWVSTLCVGEGHLMSISDQLKGIRARVVERKIDLNEALRQAFVAGASTI